MSKRIFSVSTLTPAAQADGTLSAASYAAMRPGTATDIIKIFRILLEGQAAATSPTATCLAFSSTLAVTPTALALPNSDGTPNPSASALTNLPVPFVAAGTNPTRSSAVTVPRMNLSFNAFGGICQFQATPGIEEEWVMIGNATVNKSESVLSSANVGTPGAIGANFYYEVL